MGIVDQTIKSDLDAEGILLNRGISPTTASTQLNRNLLSASRKSYNLGQGAETEKPDAVYAAIEPRTIDGDGFSHVYPKRGVGGSERAKKSAAGKVNRYFGTNVDAGHVFVLPTQGRAVLKAAITAQNGLADEGAQELGIPQYHWPMYDGMIRSARGSSASEYPNPGPDGDFSSQTFSGVDALQGIIVNGQHNPTGKIYPLSWHVGFMDYVETVNKQRVSESKKPIMVMYDMPYFHTLEANPDADIEAGECYYQDAGLKEAMEKAGDTPFIGIIPGTKAWGTANPGMTIVVMNDAAKKILEQELMQSFGLAGLDEYFEYIADFLGPEFDQPLLEHEAKLRNKYKANNVALQNGLEDGNVVSLVDGDAGMTSLLELDLDYFYGKTVHGDVTGDYEISDMNDIVEFLALNYGVVTVNNGKREGKGYLRLANALGPEKYAEAVPLLCEGLNEITHAVPPSHDLEPRSEHDDLQGGPG